jgi:hypothetical protein
MQDTKAWGKGWFGGVHDPLEAEIAVTSRKLTPSILGCEPPTNIGGLLKSGVYLLYWRNKVVFVGRSRCMLMTIAAHRSAASGPRLPEWFPIKGYVFDDMAYITTSYDRTLALKEALVSYHNPVHNRLHPTQPEIDKEGPPPISPQPMVRRL